MRISRHQMFLEIARVVSKRSTCHRLNVGAVVVVNKKVVSIGYNGPPSGQPHCQGNDCSLNESGGCSRSVHAEVNALRSYDGLETIQLYITHSPCAKCALYIINCGVRIDELYYEMPYKNDAPLKLLVKAGIKVYRHTPAGYLIDHTDNSVRDPNA